MKASLETGLPYRDVEVLLRTELARQHPRSRVQLERKGGRAIVKIDAKDTAALRAALNGVTSVLSIYEKTHGAA